MRTRRHFCEIKTFQNRASESGVVSLQGGGACMWETGKDKPRLETSMELPWSAEFNAAFVLD